MNQYEWCEVAEQFATDECAETLLQLSRVAGPIRGACHEAIRAHLTRSEARYAPSATRDRTTEWYNEMWITHRYCGRPACVSENGSRTWMWKGVYHRNEIDSNTGSEGSCPRHLPAVIYVRDNRPRMSILVGRDFMMPLSPSVFEWWSGGVRHRDDVVRDNISGLASHLPAIIRMDGTREWCFRGHLHRDDVDARGELLPAVIWPDGYCYWYGQGKNVGPH
jgi:hypothetical protein